MCPIDTAKLENIISNILNENVLWWAQVLIKCCLSLNTHIFTGLLCLHSPAHKCGNDDTPRCATTVGIGPLVVFASPAAEPNGIDEQEHKVQSQTGKRHTSE